MSEGVVPNWGTPERLLTLTLTPAATAKTAIALAINRSGSSEQPISAFPLLLSDFLNCAFGARDPNLDIGMRHGGPTFDDSYMELLETPYKDPESHIDSL